MIKREFLEGLLGLMITMNMPLIARHKELTEFLFASEEWVLLASDDVFDVIQNEGLSRDKKKWFTLDISL